MEISGKIIQALPETSGTSKAGNPWKKREYVLETQETYPKKVCFNFFGDRADQYPLTVGDVVTVSFDLSSREYNGRWYTDVSAWKAEKRDATAAPGAPMPPVNTPADAPWEQPAAPAAFGAAPAAPAMPDAIGDDLPF